MSADYPAAGNQATAYESRVAIQQQIFWLEFWLENTLEFWLKIPYTILIKKSKMDSLDMSQNLSGISGHFSFQNSSRNCFYSGRRLE